MKVSRWAAALLLCASSLTFVIQHTRHSEATERVFPLLDGRRLTLTSTSAKLILVHFWATSCPPCVAEQPSLAELYALFSKRGVLLVAVAMPYDRPDDVLGFVRAHRIQYPVALDLQGTLAKSFGGVKATPTTFILNRENRVVHQIVGPLNSHTVESLLHNISTSS